MDLNEELLEKLKRVRLLILDVDGVMTDGGIVYSDKGVESKVFNVKDGHGIKLLKRGGVDCALVTARSSKMLELRAADLGIELLYQDARDKLAAYEDILRRTGLTHNETAYVGDDLIDLPVLSRVGFSAAVSDAVEEVKERVDYVTECLGGRGAVREVSRMILRAKGLWDELMTSYLR